jgi:hypothetical protein
MVMLRLFVSHSPCVFMFLCYLFIYFSFGVWFCYFVVFCLSLILWTCDIPCNCNRYFHSWVDCKVSSIPFDECYGHLLCAILASSDAKENFNQHLLLNKVHYCSKNPLELVKISKASLPFITNKIYLAILFANVV